MDNKTSLLRHKKKKFYTGLIVELDEKIKDKIKNKNLRGIFKDYYEKRFYIKKFNELFYLKK